MKTAYVLLFAAVLAGMISLVLAGCGGQIDAPTAPAQVGTATVNPRLRVVDGVALTV
jgi:hypothetical protein